MANFLEYDRVELKYYLPYGIIQDIRKFIQPYVEFDPHTIGLKDNKYIIRSIYFDTDQLDFYYEKLDGLKIRKKLRIRTYNDVFQDNEFMPKWMRHLVAEFQLRSQSISKYCTGIQLGQKN